jgi:tripartite-type tricarboxylate transporter receptor subunit TctC
MELLSHAAGLKLRHVPHAGAGPALTAILGGHVDALASRPAGMLPHIKAGKLRALAGWGDRRVAALPEVPTFKELGYPDAEFYIWAGLFAPKGTPEPVLAKLREARSTHIPQIEAHFGRGLTPEELAILVELLDKLEGAGDEPPSDPDA